jgi:NAD(P) transhydrogenase subunit alpha
MANTKHWNVYQACVQEGKVSPDNLISALYVFALAAFLGYQVISRVPPLLHTPLMSATNAISGISLVGSIVTAGAHYNTVSTILGFTAVFCSTTNVVGGFVITDRMLKMFKRKPASTVSNTKESIKK